jgi:hypothetical protein
MVPCPFFVRNQFLMTLFVHFASPSNQVGYVPEGFTPEQWNKMKESEKKSARDKNFAAVGPRSFESRSMQSFQKDLEKGQSAHLFPVFNAKKLVAEGKLKAEEIPYMQRGGKWDNSDVKGAKKKAWNEVDKKYNPNASPTTPRYLGFVERKAAQTAATAAANKANANKKAPPQQPPKAEPKKLFGLF